MKDAATYYAENEKTLYIETMLGRKFYLLDDNPRFDIVEIAHALSMQCRYTGHTKRFYSVAEHSCLVAYIMREAGLGDPFEGLMHDATEAYLSDIASPWKVLLPDYKALDKRLETKARQFFGLPEAITAGCKKADWVALFVEAYQLIPSKAADWIAPEGVKDMAESFIRTDATPLGMPPLDANRAFMAAFNALAPAHFRNTETAQ